MHANYARNKPRADSGSENPVMANGGEPIDGRRPVMVDDWWY